MLKIHARFEAKCRRHPRYSPEKDGVAGIKGNCEICGELLKAHLHFASFLAGLAELEARIVACGGKVSSGVPAKALARQAASK